MDTLKKYKFGSPKKNGNNTENNDGDDYMRLIPCITTKGLTADVIRDQIIKDNININEILFSGMDNL